MCWGGWAFGLVWFGLVRFALGGAALADFFLPIYFVFAFLRNGALLVVDSCALAIYIVGGRGGIATILYSTIPLLRFL